MAHRTSAPGGAAAKKPAGTATSAAQAKGHLEAHAIHNLSMGIELELLLKPKEKELKQFLAEVKQMAKDEHPKFKGSSMAWAEWNFSKTPSSVSHDSKKGNRVNLYMIVEAIMHRAGVSTRYFGDNKNYTGWFVVKEHLDESYPDLANQYWGCEIVSRTMRTDDDRTMWHKEIRTVFKAIETCFDIQVTEECAMHMHLTPLKYEMRENDVFYELEELKRVAYGTFYWEALFQSILPGQRKITPWAYPNHTIPWIKDLYKDVMQGKKTWVEIWKKIEGCKDHAALLANLRSMKRETVLQEVSGEIRPTTDGRYQSTNYNNILRDCGTVEIRRFPAVRNAGRAIKWTGLGIAMMSNMLWAMRWSQTYGQSGRPSYHDFMAALKDGLHQLPKHNSEFVNKRRLRDIYPVFTEKPYNWGYYQERGDILEKITHRMNDELKTTSKTHDVSAYVNASSNPSSRAGSSRGSSPGSDKGKKQQQGERASSREGSPPQTVRRSARDTMEEIMGNDAARARSESPSGARDGQNQPETNRAVEAWRYLFDQAGQGAAHVWELLSPGGSDVAALEHQLAGTHISSHHHDAGAAAAAAPGQGHHDPHGHSEHHHPDDHHHHSDPVPAAPPTRTSERRSTLSSSSSDSSEDEEYVYNIYDV